MDALRHAWDAATKDLAVWLIRALITTLVVTLMWSFWERIRRAMFRLLGRPPVSAKQTQGPDWQEGFAVRVWPLDRLRRGFVVASNTRLLILDREVVQFELAPGAYGGHDLRRRLVRHAVGPDAVAVQVPEGGIRLERALSAFQAGMADTQGATLSLGLGVDPRGFEKLARSSRVRDGVLTKDDLFSFVEDVIQPRMAEAGEHAGAPAPASEAIIQQIADHLRQDLGLVGSVHAAAHAGTSAAHVHVSVPVDGPMA